MALQFEDTKLGAQALAYVIELYRELTVENGAPTLGTQKSGGRFHPQRSGTAPRRQRLGRGGEDRRSDDGAAAAPAAAFSSSICRRTSRLGARLRTARPIRITRDSSANLSPW
jgi:hypothetical protein